MLFLYFLFFFHIFHKPTHKQIISTQQGEMANKRLLPKGKLYTGESYLSQNGVARSAKEMRNPCKRECRYRCQERITEQEREMIFKEYYGLADKHQQWQYIGQRLGRIHTNNNRKKSTRKLNIEYNFVINDKRVNVCKKMFLNTLNISNNVIETAGKKCNQDGVLIISDLRGVHAKMKAKK